MRARLFLVAFLLVAGCTNVGDEGADASDSSGMDSDTRGFLINLGGPSTGPVPPGFDMAPFGVRENATGILVEARWTCASPTCSLDLVLVDPEGIEVGRAPGNGEATFFLAKLSAGEYQYGVETATEPVVQAEGDVAATAFYGSASPEGFSALPNATRSGP